MNSQQELVVVSFVNKLTSGWAGWSAVGRCRQHVRGWSGSTIVVARLRLLLLLLSTGAVLNGCMTFSAATGERQMAEKVSVDLVGKMQSLAGFAPADTGALQMMPPQTLFGKTLKKNLSGAGYLVEEVEYRTGSRFVSFHVDSLRSDSGASEGYTLMVGGLTLNREYRQDQRGVFPLNYIEVDGAMPSQHTANNEPLTAIASPVASPIEPVVQVAADLPASLSTIVRKNLYKTRKSNFADFTVNYKAVEDAILVFPNDSLRMTSTVRDTIADLAGRYQEGSDVFSVIGCSHGTTALQNGNELLALGRSRRVQQELIDLGIPPQKILDEGCWAPVHFDETMPRRGVVLNLKRRS